MNHFITNQTACPSLDTYVKSINGSITTTTTDDTAPNVPALPQEQLAQLFNGTADRSSVLSKINCETGKIHPNQVTYKLPILGTNAVFGCSGKAYSINTDMLYSEEVSTKFHLVEDNNDKWHMIAKTKSLTGNGDVSFTELDFFYGLFLFDRKDNYRREITNITSSDKVFLIAFLRSATKVVPCEATMVPDSDAAYLMIESIRELLRLNATKGGEY